MDVAPEHPLLELLADLRRDGLYQRLSFDGLDRRGVGALIAAHAGNAAPTSLVQAIHAETDGNPFFVGEVVRHLIETGAAFESGGRWISGPLAHAVGVPEGVKEVLTRRLARLSETSGGCSPRPPCSGGSSPSACCWRWRAAARRR